MAWLTQEQKDKVIQEAQQYGWVDSQQFKNKVNSQYWAWSYDALVNKAAQWVTTGQISWDLTKANQELWTNVTQEQADLWKQISTWNFTAEQAKRYNDLTWSQTGARDLALSTQQWANNLKTTITSEEQKTMSSEWITPWQNITTPEPVKTPEVKPTTTTETKTPEVKPQKIETIDQFKQKGANLPNLEQFIEDRYWTTAQQEADWVTAVINWEKFKWTIDADWNPRKVSLWQAVQPIQSNPDDLFKTLASWWSISQTDPNYNTVKIRYNNFTTYKNMTSGQLSSLLKSGVLLPGTQTYNDLMNDPSTSVNLKNAEKLNTINQDTTAEEKVSNIELNQSKNILNNNLTVATALSDWTLTKDEYNQLTNNSEIIEKSKEVDNLKKDFIQKKSQYDDIENQVKSELEWKRVSSWYINALINQRRKNMLNDLTLSEKLYNSALWELSTMKEESTNLLNTNLSLYKEQQARAQALADKQEERAYNEAQAQKELQQKYDYTYWDINSTNPQVQNIAIENAVKSMYEKYPLPGMESQAIKVQKIKDKIAQGMTWTQAIQEVENEIRNSNRYKQYLASESAKLQPKATESWTKLNDWTLYNQVTWETKSVTPTIDTTQTWTWYDFIKKQEWFRDKAYWDVNWWAVWYWQHSINWVPVKEWDTIDKATADADFQNRINNAKFQWLVKTNLTENQEAALYDLEHNVWSWVWNFPNGKAIIDAVNNNDFAKASNIMATSWIWTTNAKTKEVMPWLVKRRKEASKLLLDTWTAWTWQDFTENDINKFKYSEKLTPNEQNAYLKEQWLVDKYLKYNATKQETSGWLLDWISSIQDITFPEKTTEFKTKSYNYGTRMDDANKTLSNMDEKYKKSWTTTEYLAPRWEWVPNFIKSDDRQSFEQAQRNFINAVLRQESWAVISDQEFSNARKQYFPSAWDSEDVINQKKANREMAIYNMLKSAGKDEQWRDIWAIWKELNKTKSITPVNNTWMSIKSKNWNTYNFKVNNH